MIAKRIWDMGSEHVYKIHGPRDHSAMKLFLPKLSGIAFLCFNTSPNTFDLLRIRK